MLSDYREKVQTPAAQLREDLTQLENRVGQIDHGTPALLSEILPLFDHAFALLTDLQAQGASFPGEQARFETVAATFRRKSQKFLRIIGGAPALERARPTPRPDAARWWWFVDEWLAEQQRARRRRALQIGGLVTAVLAVLLGVYLAFLRPDEATREYLRRQSAAEALTVSGDCAGALVEVNAALAVKPDQMELLVFKGVLEECLESPQEAEQAFTQAQALAENQETFLLERAQKYLLLGLPEPAMADADAILAENAESAYAYFFKARAYELQDALAEADRAYTKAGELAAAAHQTELEAIIRVQQAYLFQRLIADTP